MQTHHPALNPTFYHLDSSTSNSQIRKEAQPKRPSSAYNIFFQVERRRLISNKAKEGPYSRTEVYGIDLSEEARAERSKRPHRKTHGRVTFTELATLIAEKWKNLDAKDRRLFEERANDEKRKYAIDLEDFLLRQVPTRQIKKRLSALRRGSLSKYIKGRKHKMASPGVSQCPMPHRAQDYTPGMVNTHDRLHERQRLPPVGGRQHLGFDCCCQCHSRRPIHVVYVMPPGMLPSPATLPRPLVEATGSQNENAPLPFWPAPNFVFESSQPPERNASNNDASAELPRVAVVGTSAQISLNNSLSVEYQQKLAKETIIE